MIIKLNKRSRINYWSCSKFADWIRGTNKPLALGWKEWDKWHQENKKKHPCRYWVAEEVLNFLQDIVNLPMDIYHTIEIYFHNRFITKIHYLRTGLKPGVYYDLDYRILHGLFNELVIYVEHECAFLQKYSEKSKIYKFVKGRCQQAGLDYLHWASNLVFDESLGFDPSSEDYNKPTHQAEKSLKILELYDWWINREHRVDPYDIYSLEKNGPKYYEDIDRVEKSYDKEDDDMLIELIKLRHDLWT